MPQTLHRRGAAGSALAQLEKAVALHRASQLDEAAAGYRAVLRLEPRNSEALRLLGALLLSRGESAAAITALALPETGRTPVTLILLGAGYLLTAAGYLVLARPVSASVTAAVRTSQ